jgi:hypothetical protein
MEEAFITDQVIVSATRVNDKITYHLQHHQQNNAAKTKLWPRPTPHPQLDALSS